VPVTGTADTGARFAGTFFISRFDAQGAGTGIVALGNIDGTVNGRNVITQIAVPVTVTPSASAQVATSIGAPGSCASVHVDLAPSALAAFGAAVTLDATRFDITTPQTGAATVITGVAATPEPATYCAAEDGLRTAGNARGGA
jgi:hypothetical protein